MSNLNKIDPCQLNKSTFQLIGKDWMLITAEKDGKANTMTASWGGFGVMFRKNVAYIVLRPQRYTKEFIDGSNKFSLSFLDDSFRDTLNYLGTVSGRNENKIQKSNLTLSHYKNIPYFEEAKLVITCKKLYTQTFNQKSFVETSIIDECYPKRDFHTLYISEIEDILEKK